MAIARGLSTRWTHGTHLSPCGTPCDLTLSTPRSELDNRNDPKVGRYTFNILTSISSTCSRLQKISKFEIVAPSFRDVVAQPFVRSASLSDRSDRFKALIALVSPNNSDHLPNSYDRSPTQRSPCYTPNSSGRQATHPLFPDARTAPSSRRFLGEW